MIYCPFCGHNLISRLHDGISNCVNCHRVFDTSQTNRILSAAWHVRRQHLTEIEDLKSNNCLSDQEIDLVLQYVIEKGYTHDEFLKIVKAA
jgi:Zn-finger protein